MHLSNLFKEESVLIIFEIIIFLAVLWSLAFFNVSLKLSTAIIALLLFILSFFHLWSWWILTPLWIIFLFIAIVLNIPLLRRNFISAKILKYFRSVLPPMSETERIALEAGDVWWEGELFCGKPHWKKLSAMPKSLLNPDEQAFLDNQVETLCGMLNDWEIVHRDCNLPERVWQYLKDEKFFGLVIKKEYGGHGFSALAHSTIVAKIATRSMSAAVNTMVPNSLGPAELIHHYGTSEQKNYYLPRLAAGQEIPCFALTSPEAGSDATAIIDNGIICRGEHEGQSVMGIRLNWDKRYITLAPVATVIGLAFKLYDPEYLLGKEENIGITLCLVPNNHPGVEIGKRHLPMNLAFMNGPTRGKDVFIPLDWIIGGPEMRGQGWHMLMECLAIGRGISLPALATGANNICFRGTGAYARVRKQFKMPIGKLEGVQEALEFIGGFTYICEATRRMTTSAVDQGVRPSLVSAITKYHLTELARITLNHALDIHAGKGIQLGPKNYLGLIHDAMPTSITVEGANILTRNLIIFGQGAMRCHPYIRKEMQAAKNPNTKQGLKKFDQLIFAHAGYAISNFVRSFSYGLTGGKLIISPSHGILSPYYKQLTRMSTALALVADIAMVIMGGELKRKERLSARLGDVLSYLYLASAVIRYFNNQEQPASDNIYVHWTLQWCLAKIQKAFIEFFDNFSLHWVGCLLRLIVFPWGRAYKMPKDHLGQEIAEDMLKSSGLRERLTQFCYVGEDAHDGLRILENAFQALSVAEPIRIKLQKAVRDGNVPRFKDSLEQAEAALKAGILTAEEIKLLQETERLCWDAIQVDEFDRLP